MGVLKNASCPGPGDLEGPQEFTAPSCCGKDSTSPETTMSFASWVQLQPYLLGNRGLQPIHSWQSTKFLGHSTSPIPGGCTLGNHKFLSGRESLSCTLIPTAMEGEIEEEKPWAITVAFRHSYKLHALCSGYSRWQRVQKPYPHILRKQLNILCNVWPRGTKLKFNGHAEKKWIYLV